MLHVNQADRINPLHGHLYAPDQAMRLGIDIMRRCFMAQGYREN